MALPTFGGPTEVWSIYVRYSPTSAFADNILNMAHAWIKMGHISLPDRHEAPSIRLNGKAFKLHTRETRGWHPSGPLFLQLPLQSGFSSTPALGGHHSSRSTTAFCTDQ